MENRGTHGGRRQFIKSISVEEKCRYEIWEYTMRYSDNTVQNVYMVRCVWHDGQVISEFLYGDYEKACEMIEYFII